VLKRHRLRYLGIGGVLLALAPTLIAAQEPVIRGPIGQRLDSLLQAAEAQGFHGSALVAQHDTVLLLTGYGFANEETHTRYTAVTLVQIGSNVKDFTKVAIYQLLEQGRLHLTDSLPLFLDGVAESKRRITIEQLLDHTAGLPLGLTPDATPVTKAEMLERLNALALASSPGTRRAYSNLGYSMLAVIIERVSSQPYDTYVAENILRPAEMLETGTYLPRFDRARIAHGYEGSRDVGGILDMPHDADGHLWALRGNGGYLSTLNDMRRFYRALRGPGLLADEAHRRAVVSTANPQVLAGSDMRSFFLFGNFPGADVEIFLASNHSAYKASRLLEPIEQVMGIQVPSGGSRQLSAPLVERLPDTGVGHTITAYLDAYNSGDTVLMRRFFAEHSISGPDAPPLALPLQRYREMRANLGRLTLRGVRQSPDGMSLAVSVTTENGDPATLTFLVEEDAPYRMRGVRVEVGQ
jgi:CubicO group peptidase (beta-lactamase class C family)